MTRARRSPSRITSAHDGGFSLVEALVAMTIFVTAMSVMSSVVLAMTNNVRQAQGVSVATDQTRLAFQRLDKQVRYATAINAPGSSAGGYYVEFSRPDPAPPDAPSAAGAVPELALCEQWRLLGRTLQTRTWRTTNGKRVGAPPVWRTVATGVTNDIAGSTPLEPPFTAAPAGGLLQGLTVDLRTRRSDQPVGRAHLKGTFYARNTNPTPGLTPVCQHFPRS